VRQEESCWWLRAGIGALLIALPVLESCAPKRAEVALNTSLVPAGELIHRVGEREQRLRSLTGSGTLSFRSPQESGTASFELSLKRPDSLLVTLEGPFGIDIGLLFLSRERYVMYNSFENLAIIGSPSSGSLRSLIPLELTFDELMNTFSGMMSLPSDPLTPESYGIDDDQFLLTYSCNGNTCMYWVDPAYLAVARYQVLNPDGEILVEARYSSFADAGGLSFPRKVSIEFPIQHRSLSLAYAGADPNGDEPSFLFSIPHNARVVSR
jgi:Domain of unknown function (DUF4292)